MKGLAYILDANANEVLKFGSVASAVNELTATNAATGNPAILSATGGDTNIDISLTPKGSGRVRIGAIRNLTTLADANNNEVVTLASVASAVNEFTITNAATGNHPTIAATGGDSNINVVLTPKGSGILVFQGSTTVSGVLSISPTTATAPIILSANGQGQLCVGLNADELDGEDGSFYRNASNINAGTLDAARLPAGFGSALLYAATASVAHTGTTEATLIGSGVGSLTLAANFWTAGKTLVIEAWGTISTDAVPDTLVLNLSLDAVNVCTTTALTPANAIVDRVWHVRIVITCRTTGATGTVFGQGAFSMLKLSTAQDEWPMGNISATTIDTTQADAINLSADWASGSGNNVITCTNFMMWAY